jgi:outer membrane protein OmpA-like peptidoglycan-associated protein/tetratricopeptide (TPR) repeat protein
MLYKVIYTMKKTYPILLLSLGLILGGCGANYFVKQGNKKFDAYAYSDAVVQYKKALEKSKNSAEAKVQLANAYRLMNNPSAAEGMFREVIAIPDTMPINQFYFGKVLMQNQKYDEAKKAFEQYAKSVPDDKIVKGLIDACVNPKKFNNVLDTCAYEVKKVELSGINTAFGATPYNFGYVFAGQSNVEDKKLRDPYSGLSYMDLFFTKKDKAGKWSAPDPIKGGVNTEYHDAFGAVSADGQTMYFTRTNQFKGKVKTNADKVVNLKILKATLLEGEWTNIEEFPYNSDEFSNGHPALSADGKTMYFSSDRPGGYGQTDIYMCTLNAGTWSEPVNAGPMINTAGRDMMPQIGFNEKLYFSSDGHAGMGGLDVFVTSKSGSTFKQPENMKSPINSSSDDFSFNLNNDGKTGNLTSSRSGSDQLFEVIYKDPIIPAEICVQDKISKEPFVGCTVYATNKETGEVDSAITNSRGVVNFRFKGGFNFTVNARYNQTLTNSIELSTIDRKCSDLIVSCKENKFIELEKTVGPRALDIYYDYNKANIRPDAALELDKLVKLLTDNPQYKIEFGSHTDCRGDDKYNQRLSEARAKSVFKYCKLRDIDAKRLTYKGYGESQPKTNCDCPSCSEEQHQLNRRTEFKIIE